MPLPNEYVVSSSGSHVTAPLASIERTLLLGAHTPPTRRCTSASPSVPSFSARSAISA
jgi:hypothetical protein